MTKALKSLFLKTRHLDFVNRNNQQPFFKDCIYAIFRRELNQEEYDKVHGAFLDDFRRWREVILKASRIIAIKYSRMDNDISLSELIKTSNVKETFSPWLRFINQNSSIQDACINRLKIYMVHICEDLVYLENNGRKSSWIWSVLSNWDYLTYSMPVPTSCYWSIGNAFDLVSYDDISLSRQDIINNPPRGKVADSVLTKEQSQYLSKTSIHISRKYMY
jgi:hypothetical protein